MTAARQLNSVDRSDIAIVGMSGRFPGARTIDAFWQNLKDGVESRTTFSDDELLAQGVPSSALNHPAWVKSGFVLEDVDAFDSAFFGFNPREADVLDPQHRLFLETAWEALEDAGYDTERFKGSVAVFGGATYAGYPHQNVFRNVKVVKSVGGRQAIYGSVPEYMVTRVAYKLNLRGPVYFVQTACSTSLVAVHLGCQSLNNHESDMVLAGGVSVQLPHRLGYLYEEGGMLSPDGAVRSFDIRGRGTVFSSGVGIVVLKRLSDAIADGDSIRAVIKGVAANNDGSFKVGFTAPSVTGQAQVVAEALANAQVSPDSIGYVETHGTGTELGDPIEVSALTRAFRASTDRKGFCPIGSIKPNVGHLDAAAGVSSLIKTVLALEHSQIPPTINFEHPNPKIDFENSPFFVNTELRAWPANGEPRRAGVSSFGFGGTNAHVIVQEKPVVEPSGPSRSRQLLVLSAKTEDALDASSKRLAEFLGDRRQINLADVAHTLRLGRRVFANRRAVVCSSAADAVEALHGSDDRRVLSGSVSGTRPVVFMFPGQGAQYVNMGLGLYQEEPIFRETVDDCAQRLLPHLGFDLREVLYPAEGVTEATSDRLKQTAVTQVALFVVELALARLWMAWGVAPAAMVGHSIGEFVAAHLAGVIGLDDVLRLVAARGRLMGEMPGGVMLAVPLPEAELRPLIEPGLWISAVNGPSLTVVSGARADIDQLTERLRNQGIEARPLHTSHAFHSGMMDGAVAPLVDIATTIELRAPQIPYISNVTGTWISDEQACDPEYWGRHLRQAVRFSDGVAELFNDQTRMFLELGPGNVLCSLIRYQARTPGSVTAVPTLRQAQEQASDEAVLLTAMGRLWTSGAEINWPAFAAGERRLRVSLPTYPFARTRHWVEPEIVNRAHVRRMMAITEQIDFSDWFHVPTWKRSPVLARNESVPGTSLVFLDETGLGARLAARQERLGSRVVTVSAGSAFNRLDDERFEIDPSSPGDYSTLVRALVESNRMPDVIAHLWGVTKESTRSTAKTQTYEERGFYSLLYLAQALGETGATSPIRLISVTDGLCQVTGTDSTIPEKAAATGPCRVIPYEFPHIAVRQLDLEVVARGEDDAQIDQILAEFADDTSRADVLVAYRRRRRWTCIYDPVVLAPTGDRLPPRIRQEGVYLITGGLGGVGLVLAEHLARTVKARLVLTGRRGLPPRATWDEYLTAHGAQDATSRKIRAVQSLEALGAEVLIGSADVVDEPAMRAVVAEARRRFGRIDGVVHAAGIAGGGMIQLKKREVAASVLAPKVIGTQVLERVLDGQPLDFLLLCSSLTGVLGGVGQVDYCGANAYLDAFAAHHAATTGTFTVSVNWNAWREVGMAVDTDIPEGLRDTLRASMLATGISNKQGLDAFFRILTHVQDSQVALSPVDVDVFGTVLNEREATQPGSEDQVSAESGARQQKAHPRPNLQTPYEAPASKSQQQICAIWEDALGIERVGINDNFFDLGGHSLLAIQVMGRVNQAMHTKVPVAKLYEGLTVAFLSSLMTPRAETAAPVIDDDDQDSIDRRRDKARRQKEQQQRRRVALGR
jgi:acyl transferase domain-containing protein